MMAERWQMVGVPVLGKLLGCRTVSVVGVRRVDTMGCLLGRSAAVAVAGRAVVVAAAAGVVAVAAEEGHHNLAAAETKTDTKLLSLEYHYVTLKENSLQLRCLNIALSKPTKLLTFPHILALIIKSHICGTEEEDIK